MEAAGLPVSKGLRCIQVRIIVHDCGISLAFLHMNRAAHENIIHSLFWSGGSWNHRTVKRRRRKCSVEFFQSFYTNVDSPGARR